MGMNSRVRVEITLATRRCRLLVLAVSSTTALATRFLSPLLFLHFLTAASPSTAALVHIIAPTSLVHFIAPTRSCSPSSAAATAAPCSPGSWRTLPTASSCLVAEGLCTPYLSIRRSVDTYDDVEIICDDILVVTRRFSPLLAAFRRDVVISAAHEVHCDVLARYHSVTRP